MEKNKFNRIFALITIFLFVNFSIDAVAFNIPEKLTYDLTWTGLKAGTATLEIVDEQDSIKIISTAHSSDWVSLFYTVDDRIDSRLMKMQNQLFPGLTRNYRAKIREGRHRRDKEIVFDHDKHTAVLIDHIKNEERKLEIHGDLFDPLSSLYYVRRLNIEVGKSVFVDILDNKKIWNVEVQILRKEKVKTKLGDFDTVVIKPIMKSEGIFNRKGDMYIWLTDDDKHIPVKMQTKVAVGTITATLSGGNF